jgi:DNA-directed RNA polymerase specialized sigma24 family protein
LRFYYGLSNRDIAEMENIALRKVRAWGDLAMKKFINNG